MDVKDFAISNVFPNIIEYEVEKISRISSCASNDQFKAVLRLKCHEKNDLLRWKMALEEKTNVKWIVRSTNPNVRKFTYSVDFCCQKNSHNKTKRESESCMAKLDFRIKHNTRDTRYKDKFVKKGYLSVVIISWAHNHQWTTAACDQRNVASSSGNESHENEVLDPKDGEGATGQKSRLQDEINQLQRQHEAMIVRLHAVETKLQHLQEDRQSTPDMQQPQSSRRDANDDELLSPMLRYSPSPCPTPRCSTPTARCLLENFAIFAVGRISETARKKAAENGASVYIYCESMIRDEQSTGRTCLIIGTVQEYRCGKQFAGLHKLPFVDVEWLNACVRTATVIPYEKYIR